MASRGVASVYTWNECITTAASDVRHIVDDRDEVAHGTRSTEPRQSTAERRWKAGTIALKCWGSAADVSLQTCVAPGLTCEVKLARH